VKQEAEKGKQVRLPQGIRGIPAGGKGEGVNFYYKSFGSESLVLLLGVFEYLVEVNCLRQVVSKTVVVTRRTIMAKSAEVAVEGRRAVEGRQAVEGRHLQQTCH
jgi:hypothetical protein